MTERERCETCRYWALLERGREWSQGHCRRYPPTRTTGDATWPKTWGGAWCGEWRERDPQPWDVQQR